MSPFDVPESDKITLVTADDPPQSFIVSRSRLTVLSDVCRDLLSTPTTAEDEAKGEIPLTEKAQELKGFLMVLQDEEEKLSNLAFEEWYSLADMADKFDCKAASNAALMRAWEFVADGDKYEAFRLAILTSNEKLIRRLGLTAVDDEWHQELQCPVQWTDRLEKARLHRLSRVRNELLNLKSWNISCKHGCDELKREVARNDAAYTVMQEYRCSESVETQLRARFEGLELRDVDPLVCGDCIEWLCAQVIKLDRDLSSELELVDSA